VEIEWNRKEAHSTALEKQQHWFSAKNYYRTTLILFLWSFTQIGSTVISYLRCIEIDVPNQGQISVVATHPAIRCQSDEYKIWYVVALAFLISIIGLIPASILYHMSKYRSIIINENQSIEFNSRHNAFLELWGVMFEPYKPKFWFWEIAIILVRRLAMIILNTSLSLLPMYKFLSFTWFHALTLWIQWRYEPFVVAFDNQVEILSVTLLALLSSLLIIETVPFTITIQIVVFFLFPFPGALLLLAIFSRKARTFYERYLTKKSNNTFTFGGGPRRPTVLNNKASDGKENRVENLITNLNPPSSPSLIPLVTKDAQDLNLAAASTPIASPVVHDFAPQPSNRPTSIYNATLVTPVVSPIVSPVEESAPPPPPTTIELSSS
jgi:hypothetical protein